MLKDRFDNITKISAIHTPVLITHGTDDTIVTPREGQKLFERANMPKELYLIEGADHNTIQSYDPPTYWATISAWLDSLT